MVYCVELLVSLFDVLFVYVVSCMLLNEVASNDANEVSCTASPTYSPTLPIKGNFKFWYKLAPSTPTVSLAVEYVLLFPSTAFSGFTTPHPIHTPLAPLLWAFA